MSRTFDPIVTEQDFIRFIRGHGTPRPAAKRYDPMPPISTDGVTDCWTHAWEYAVACDLAYVEGICTKRPGVLATHAWCEVTNFLGSYIVELTEGFEHAPDYIGVPIHVEVASSLTRDWENPRVSVLQAVIAGNWPVTALRTLVAET